MMNLFARISLVTLSCLSFHLALSQIPKGLGPERFQVDTMLVFQEGINDYDFVFDGPTQGFYWGAIGPHVNCRLVQFHISNNTSDTLELLKIGGGDGSFIFTGEVWMGSQGFRKLAPGEEFDVRILQNRINSPGPLQRTFSLTYKRNEEVAYLLIKNWGYSIPIPSENKKELLIEQTEVDTSLVVKPKPSVNQNKAVPTAFVQSSTQFPLEITLNDFSLNPESIQVVGWIGQEKFGQNGIWDQQTWQLEIPAVANDTIYLQLSTEEYGVFYKTRFVIDQIQTHEKLSIPMVTLFSNPNDYVYNLYKGRDSSYHTNYYRIEGDISLKALNQFLKIHYHTTATEFNNGFYVQIEHYPNVARMEKFFIPRIKHFAIYPVVDKYKERKGNSWWLNKFSVQFYDEISATKAKYIFQQLGIKIAGSDAYSSPPVYYFTFPYLFDKNTIITLEKLYARKEVVYISQHIGRIRIED